MEKKKRNIIIVLMAIGLVVIILIPFIPFMPYEGDGGTGTTKPSTEYNIIPPTLEPIIPNPSNDGEILLQWDDAETINSGLPSELELMSYKVYRRKDSGSWSLYKTPKWEYCYISERIEGTYEYKVLSAFYKPTETHYSDFSNVQSVVVDLKKLPSNPSIVINDGAETTNSFEVILTLSCDNADEMQFQISTGIWTDWIVYSTTYTIILLETDPDFPDYRVGVVFRNEVGTTKDAEYGDIYDDIRYDSAGEPPPIPPKDNRKPDYTLRYILIGVLIGVVGIGISLKYRKRIIKSN